MNHDHVASKFLSVFYKLALSHTRLELVLRFKSRLLWALALARALLFYLFELCSSCSLHRLSHLPCPNNLSDKDYGYAHV